MAKLLKSICYYVHGHNIIFGRMNLHPNFTQLFSHFRIAHSWIHPALRLVLNITLLEKSGTPSEKTSGASVSPILQHYIRTIILIIKTVINCTMRLQLYFILRANVASPYSSASWQVSHAIWSTSESCVKGSQRIQYLDMPINIVSLCRPTYIIFVLLMYIKGDGAQGRLNETQSAYPMSITYG